MAQPVLPNPIKGQVVSFRQPGASQKKAGGIQQPTDIIRQSAGKELPPGSDVESFLKQVALLVQKQAIKLLQLGNTVFLLYPRGNGEVEFHTFTTEPPQQLIERYKAGVNSLRQLGYKRASSYAESPAFVKIAQQTGLPVRTSKQMMRGKPVYRFEVDL